MIKLLIAIPCLASAASTLNISEVINSTKTNTELPLFEANMFAMKAFLKVWWFTTELMGEEIRSSFSNEDKAVLKEIVWTIKLRSEEETNVGITDLHPSSIRYITYKYQKMHLAKFFAELMKKSPDLGARVKSMYDLRKKQLAELKPEVQAFAENITEFMWNTKFLDEKALPPSTAEEIAIGIINKFRALPDDVKDDFQKAFPAAAAYLTSEDATERLQQH